MQERAMIVNLSLRSFGMTKPPLAKDILMSMTACPSPRDKETNRRGRKRAAAMLLMEILLPKV